MQKKTALIVDRAYAQDIGCTNFISLFPNHTESCEWIIPKEQYCEVTRQIIQASKEIEPIFVDRFFSQVFSYKKKSLASLYNGFGGLFCFFIADRLLRINKLLEHTMNKEFALPNVQIKYNLTWPQQHLFYNLIEQDPEFNQWLINSIFHDWPRLSPNENEKIISEFFDDHLPYATQQLVKRTLLTRFLNKIWSSQESGLNKITIFRFIRSLSYISVSNLKKMTRKIRYFISSFGHNLAWDGIGPLPDPQYETWRFLWPLGRLSFVGESLVEEKSFQKTSALKRETILDFKNDLADIFEKLIIKIDKKCNIEKKYLQNIAQVWATLIPRCFIEDAEHNTKIFLEKMQPFSRRHYFCGGTFAAYSSSYRVFACKELDIKITSCQHSAWGGYLANGPLITEYLIKGCDDYVTFGWSNKPLDGSVWANTSLQMCSPLLSEMQNRKIKRVHKTFQKRVLLCPGFIYRFPSIYNSSLRVDNIKIWSQILDETVKQLNANGIAVDILMYNKVMAANMKTCLETWLKDCPLAQTYLDHNTKVRHILNDPDFYKKYDAIVWDLLAGGFTEAVASGIPTFALWSPHIHIETPESREYLADLKKEGHIFENGQELVKNLNKMYIDNKVFLIEQSPALQKFFNQYVRMSPDWKQQWTKFFAIHFK